MVVKSRPATETRQPIALAKISRPKLYGVIVRERLFASIDQQRRHPLVWVDGPPGAGKTTLIATYLESRKQSSIWYQVDPGDADPASFFYYLALAAAAGAQNNRKPLPLLNPEYLGDLPAFTRRFFREFYGCMPANSVLVLDNYQEVTLASAFHVVVRDALAEMPAGTNIVVISRADPPAQYARAVANKLIGRIEWADLRLTMDETALMVAEQHIDEAALHSLQEQSNGWAAGVILMLERLKRTGTMSHLDRSETMDTVFNYFASQVFDHTPTETRQLLLRTAFLPSVTVNAAEDLSANPAAGLLLDELYRRHLFTDRRVAAEVAYQYHALFRRFLQARVGEDFGVQERRVLQQRSALLLEKSGHADEALQLHAEAADWNTASNLIIREARALIAQGRWLTLKAWIARLPAEHVERSPWLQLWLGSALVLINPAEARRLLTRVFDQFVVSNEPLGQLLAAIGTVESCNIEHSNFTMLDPWIAALDKLLDTAAFPSPAIKMRANGAMMLASILRQPGHARMQHCAQCVMDMLDDDISVTSKADAATQLLQYYDFAGDLERAASVVVKAAPAFQSAELSPLRRAGWLIFYSYHSLLSGSYREGFEALDQASAIADEYGLPWFRFFNVGFRVLLHLMRGEAAAATPLLTQLAALVDPSRPAEVAQYQFGQTMLCQVRGDVLLAAHHGQLCLDAARRSGSACYGILFAAVAAAAFVEAGEYEKALTVIGEARTQSRGTAYEHYEALLTMVEAYAAGARNDVPRCQQLLRRALILGRETNSANLFRWLVAGLRRMLAQALQAGIESETARSIIQRFSISPESAEIEEWPWPIKIYTLGRFEIEINGVPLRFGRKAPKKPLEMLKLLVAAGGRDVDATSLGDTLWPDAEGGAAKDSFEITLRRLRKLLGRDEVVVMSNGRLSLDTKICWIDTWALDQLQHRTEELLREVRDAPGHVAELRALLDRSLRLYAGHLLPGAESFGWVLSQREGIAGKFLRSVNRVAQRLEEEQEQAKAELVYQRVLELDPLAESTYQRLMIVQARQGHQAAALATYGRCRQTLLRSLGTKPSNETEAIRRSLAPC
jgi:ATP/maltotriose-dependent transcriptional regulator MalT/DNA-binding SARP family transcriptional activator